MDESDLTGTTVSRYRILSRLGSGGMGEVYLAEDTTLHRRVAIKFPTRDLTPDARTRDRLVREARLAAALDHPNIGGIYEVGDDQGRSFIVMPYIEGETLAARLERQPPSLDESIVIAAQIADALAEAHARGIFHRDIKPGNIMLTARGQVKVMDFGLAKLAPEQADTDVETHTALSVAGRIIGTVGYMSPEQVRGERVDARSDLFSLGLVLYEMIAGRRPYAGLPVTETIAAVLKDELEPLARYVPNIPSELQRVVSKLLRKDRETRYQTARDLLTDLRDLSERLTSGATETATPATVATVKRDGDAPRTSTGAGIRKYASAGVFLIAVVIGALWFVYFRAGRASTVIDSLAVLPFVATGDVDSEYLGDGITDSLIRSLAQLPNLKVKSRAAVFRYKGRDIDPQMVAQELGVRAVLTGRLAQRKDDLSLSVELVDAAESNQIWGEQYHRKLSDILQVQEEVTSRIVENLQLQLTGQQQRQLTLRATANADAYRLYLKGRYYADRLTKEGFDRSLESFNQAIAIDPNYALAHQGVAHAHFQTLDLLFAPREAALRATAAARRALAIDETVAEAHETLAAVFWQYEWDWAGAEREFKRAIELNPQAATVQMNYGLFLALMGRFAEGRRALTRARELDPHDPFSIVVTSFSHYLARRSDDALKEALEAVRVDPDFWLAHSLLARVYAVKNRFPDAIGEMQKARRLDDGNGEILMDLGRVHGLAEQKAEARRVLTELQQLSTRRYVAPFHFAMVYTGLGDRDEAFAWLEKAYDARSWYLTWLKTAPEVDSLRSDPRFADLVRRIGLPR